MSISTKKSKLLLMCTIPMISLTIPANNTFAARNKYENLYAGAVNNLINTYSGTAESVEFNEYSVYTNCYVNFREKPTTESEIIYMLEPNTQVTVIGVYQGWCNVVLNEICGYIKSEFLSKDIVSISELNRWNIDLTKDEIDILANILYLEAGIDSSAGKEAVVESIFNRMVFSKSFHGDLYSVLSSPGQYSTWELQNKATPKKEEYQVIKNVLYGITYQLDSEYVYFSKKKSNGHDFIMIGLHWFGKE